MESWKESKKESQLKQYAAVLSTVLSIALAILNLNEKIGHIVPGMTNYAIPLVVAVLLGVAILLQWQQLSDWLARSPTNSRLTLWATAVVVVVFIATTQFNLPWRDGVQLATLVTVVVVGLIEIQRYGLDTLKTEYLGPFPANLPTVIELVKAANTSVKILTDVFAYGAFSDAANYNKLVNSLLELPEKNVAITWYSYTEEQAKKSVMKQLEWEKLEKEPISRSEFLTSERMKTFHAKFGGGNPLPSSLTEFIETVLIRRNKAMQDWLEPKGCRFHAKITTELPLYIWLVDNRAAVFCVLVRDGDAVREEAFLTRDPALIAVLQEVGSTYWGKP